MINSFSHSPHVFITWWLIEQMSNFLTLESEPRYPWSIHIVCRAVKWHSLGTDGNWTLEEHVDGKRSGALPCEIDAGCVFLWSSEQLVTRHCSVPCFPLVVIRHLFAMYDQNNVNLRNATEPKCNRIWQYTVTGLYGNPASYSAFCLIYPTLKQEAVHSSETWIGLCQAT
jgi:hypothetical protein